MMLIHPMFFLLAHFGQKNSLLEVFLAWVLPGFVNISLDTITVQTYPLFHLDILLPSRYLHFILNPTFNVFIA